MPTLIGLCGYAQVGKDTLADMLKGEYIKRAFAYKLKVECERMLSAINIFVDLRNDEETKKKYRDLLVAWGRIRRAENPLYWVEAVINDLQDKPTIITDVRYSNEVKAILDKGGKIIRLHRKGYKPANKEEKMTIGLIDKQYGTKVLHINNNGTKEDLLEAFRRL